MEILEREGDICETRQDSFILRHWVEKGRWRCEGEDAKRGLHIMVEGTSRELICTAYNTLFRMYSLLSFSLHCDGSIFLSVCAPVNLFWF